MDKLEDIRILVVEDDQSLLQMVSALLEAEGYTVVGASDGETAIQLANDEAFDLVVTDIKLGELDGLDTLSELKKTESTLQSLVMTGYSTEEDTIRALQLGVGNYLKKPFSLDDFLLAVQEQVRRALVEKQVQRRERAALKTLCWALDLIASRDLEEGEGDTLGPRRAAVLAERAARVLQLTPQNILAVKALTLLDCLRQGGQLPWDEEALRGFPPVLTRLLDEVEEGNFDSGSLQAQVVFLSVASSTIEADKKSLTEDLKEQFPQLSAELSKAFELAYTQEVAHTPEQKTRGRSLLSLASALQARGDRAAASLCLARLNSESTTAESTMAQLLQARLQWEEQQVEGARSGVDQALQQAGSLGQKALAKASLEGGLLLAEMAQDNAADVLQSARELLAEHGSSEQRARAQLGLIAIGQSEESLGESLGELMQARHLESFLRSGPWLLPLLLRMEAQEAKPEVLRASRRLIRDLPDLLASQIKRGMPKPSLMSALKGIAAVGKTGHEETLQWLTKTSDQTDIVRAAEKLLGEAKQNSLPPVLRIYLSGGFETWFGNSLLTWSGTKYQYILAYICSDSRTSVPLGRIVREVLAQSWQARSTLLFPSHVEYQKDSSATQLGKQIVLFGKSLRGHFCQLSIAHLDRYDRDPKSLE